MIIEIILKTDEGEVMAKKEARGFEGAYEDLGKLERYYEKQEEELEKRLNEDDIKYEDNKRYENS